MLRASSRHPITKVALCACLVLTALTFAACGSRQEHAQNYYESGMKFLDKHEYAKARVEFKNALQLKNDMLPAWRALSKVEEHEKNLQAFAGSLRRVVELDAKDFKSRVRLAKLYLLGGAVDDALKVTNAAAKLDPKNADVHALKAAILFRLKDTDGATREAHTALEIEPGNADASVVLAADRFVKGNTQAALKLLEAIKGPHADDLGVIALKLSIYNRLKQPEQVKSLLKRLVKLHPNEATFRSQLVRFYLAHKRPKDAEEELRTVVTQNPKDVVAQLQLANLMGALKGADAARTELVTRIKAGGRVFPYQIALARFDFGRGKVANAVKELEGLISSSKSVDDVLSAKVTLAELYMTKKDIAKAEPLVSEILSTDKRNIVGLRLRAAIRLSRGKTDDAIADLREALNDQPHSALLLSSLALAYEHSGSIDLANEAYLKAVRNSGYRPALGLRYVAFLQRRGLGSQVGGVLDQLVRHNPTNVAVLSALAKEKLAHRDWKAAHAIADRIKRLGGKRDLVVADQIYGFAFGGENKLNDSLTALKSVYEAAPGAAQPMAAIVQTYVRAHQTEKAESFLQSVLKANPHNAEALVLFGALQLNERKPDEAVKYFKSAIKEQPKSAAAYSALSNLYGRQGKLEAALQIIDAGLKQQPKGFRLRLSRAGLLEAKQDYDAAISEYESMLKDQPGSMIVVNNLASLLADHRTDNASLEQAKSLVTVLKQADVPQFKDTLGWVAYRTGDYANAVKLLEAAAEKLPKVGLISYHLGMSYLASGEQEKGLKELEKAGQLAGRNKALKAKVDAAIKEHPVKPGNKQTRENGAQPG